MAQIDKYVVDLGKMEVAFDGTPIARFNRETHEVEEFMNNGKRRNRWIKEVLKKTPKYNPEDVFDYNSDEGWETIEGIRLNEIDFYAIFPDAPHPHDNPVSFQHEEIYEWVKAKDKEMAIHLCPKGPWTRFGAGLGANKLLAMTDEERTATVT